MNTESSVFMGKLSNYAQLIVRHGLNVQPGQMVNIGTEMYHRELAYLVAKECYEAGASYVQLDLGEPRLAKDRLAHSSLEQMKYIPAWVTPKFNELVESQAANLRIVGMEYPDILTGQDPKKINISRMAGYHAAKQFYEQGIEKSRVHWTVAAAATPSWGLKVFPGIAPEEACAKLWESLFKICRVDRPDFLEAWREHNKILRDRASRLTELKISALHFTGPGTDLVVGLSKKAKFKGGSDTGPRGVDFEPNLPTEECFTTPDWRRTEGKVRATRPFLINGQIIKNLELEFRAGEIASFKCDSGEETFKEYSSSDPGGKRLGEVALVGIDSPIFQTGLIFEEILLDENAACHIAIGSAYKFCLEDGDKMAPPELELLGCNESSVHTDIMISSEEVSVHAVLYSGKTVLLIRNGEWVNW